MINTIFLDMDGVMVHLDAVLEQMEGRTIEAVRRDDARPGEDFDPYIALMRKHMDKEPFIQAPPLQPDFAFLCSKIQEWRRRGLRIEILSSATRHEDLHDEILRQKKEWLKIHGVDLMVHKSNFAKGAHQKGNWATPNALLIDDYKKNIDRFVAAGGHGIVHSNVQATASQLAAMGL